MLSIETVRVCIRLTGGKRHRKKERKWTRGGDGRGGEGWMKTSDQFIRNCSLCCRAQLPVDRP